MAALNDVQNTSAVSEPEPPIFPAPFQIYGNVLAMGFVFGNLVVFVCGLLSCFWMHFFSFLFFSFFSHGSRVVYGYRRLVFLFFFLLFFPLPST